MKMSEKIVELEKEIEELNSEIYDKNKRIEELNSEIYDKNKRIMELEKKVFDMEHSLEIADSRLKDVSNSRLYLEGQVEVLKRVSGLYKEEIPTHDEFEERDKEILSPVDLPF